MRNFLTLSFCLLTFTGFAQPANIFEVTTGNISFNSEAPKELISAASGELKGLMDVVKKSFVFKISVSTFVGFNSPLQQEHFKENYMETTVFPEAVYRGKIIDDVDFTKDGTYTVRTKGKLTIHGIETERIIKADVTIQKSRVTISASFPVLLQDHNIKIPRVVYEKLASEIKVNMTATLKPKA